MQTIFNRAKHKQLTQAVFVQAFKDELDRIQYHSYCSRNARDTYGPSWGKPLYRINVKPKRQK